MAPGGLEPDQINGNLRDEHGRRAATGLDVYLCEPHSPWQRPTNANTNGRRRQWLPRAIDFYGLERGEVERVAASLNNRPRRTLDWQTPADLFAALTAARPVTRICAVRCGLCPGAVCTEIP